MILIMTDTFDQVNGVSTTYKNIIEQSVGNIQVLHPGMFNHTSSSIYPEMQICTQPIAVWQAIKAIGPTHIHIATEGIMGMLGQLYCKLNKIKYTTAYHTKFPEFLKELVNIPMFITYAYLRWFHRKSHAILTTTNTMCRELAANGMTQAVPWTRGVDTEYLGPARVERIERTRPVLLSVGRVSKEKNLDVFCSLDSQMYDLQVVGDGPYLEELKQKYPLVQFLGYKHGTELGELYANADCFVFTSLTDTFGLVMIESMCMGTPVAAFEVTGPTDAIDLNVTGVYSNDLEESINQSLSMNRQSVASFARNKWNWQNAYNIFVQHVYDNAAYPS